MPAILERCVQGVMAKGHGESSAWAICRASLGLATDGSQDGQDLTITDTEMKAKVETHMIFTNGPILRKKMTVSKPIGKVQNGPVDMGVLDKKRIRGLVENQRNHSRQIPIFLDSMTGGEHPPSNDLVDPVGWAEAVSQDANGDLVIDAKLHGLGAAKVGGDLVRGASIYTTQGKDYAGKSIGEVLKHILLSNEAFITDLNVAASRFKGGERPMVYLTALKENAMGTEKLAADPNDQKKADPTEDEPSALALKAKDEQILTLKAENLQLQEAVDDLKQQIATIPADKDKEALALRVKSLEIERDAQTVRELVSQGLRAATLKPSWCSGYADGKGAARNILTLSWFKASKFGGDLKLLEWAVVNNPPMYRTEKTFVSGIPSEATEKTLTQDQKDYIRKQGMDPDKVLAAMTLQDPAEVMAAMAGKKE